MLRVLAALCLAVSLAAPAATPVSAATVQLVADPGRVTPLVTVNPGVYGVEIRGGRAGSADWELGVGTQTSKNNTPATFASGHVTWPALPALLDYTLSWAAGRVQLTVGTTTVAWNAAWQVGNAVTVSMKATGNSGGTAFSIATLDGVAVNWSQSMVPGPMQHFTFWGAGLVDGWVMTGRIGMSPNGGSARAVTVTTAEYVPPVPVPAALPLLALALGGLLLAGRRRRA